MDEEVAGLIGLGPMMFWRGGDGSGESKRWYLVMSLRARVCHDSCDAREFQ